MRERPVAWTWAPPMSVVRKQKAVFWWIEHGEENVGDGKDDS